ncbi:MAG: hypothetical protein NZ765_13505, partial [Anaerolineae bacterium]|nr:hypothetical protein [Anaerolineae bacterium]
MSQVLFWPLRNDPWLDNGLERWGRLLEYVSQQHPHLLGIEWRSDGLVVHVHDLAALVPVLDDALTQQVIPNLFYTYTNRQ